MTTSERLHYEGKALHYTNLLHDEIKDLSWDEQRYFINEFFYFLSEELRNTFIEEENEKNKSKV